VNSKAEGQSHGCIRFSGQRHGTVLSMIKLNKLYWEKLKLEKTDRKPCNLELKCKTILVIAQDQGDEYP
jgi:hypothetical protein